jgi:hypothetical protein
MLAWAGHVARAVRARMLDLRATEWLRVLPQPEYLPRHARIQESMQLPLLSEARPATAIS